MQREVTVAFRGATLIVRGDYTPGRKAVMTLPNGDPGHPAEPEEFEVEQVLTEHRDDVTDLVLDGHVMRVRNRMYDGVGSARTEYVTYESELVEQVLIAIHEEDC